MSTCLALFVENNLSSLNFFDAFVTGIDPIHMRFCFCILPFDCFVFLSVRTVLLCGFIICLKTANVILHLWTSFSNLFWLLQALCISVYTWEQACPFQWKNLLGLIGFVLSPSIKQERTIILTKFRLEVWLSGSTFP
jgi:hypothetical protein